MRGAWRIGRSLKVVGLIEAIMRLPRHLRVPAFLDWLRFDLLGKADWISEQCLVAYTNPLTDTVVLATMFRFAGRGRIVFDCFIVDMQGGGQDLVVGGAFSWLPNVDYEIRPSSGNGSPTVPQ